MIPHSLSSSRSFSLLVLLAFALPPAEVGAEKNWTQFRGPTGRGHSADENVPLMWSSKSVRWKTRLNGKGQSSVVNWGERLFVTGASDNGRERHVSCVDAATGRVNWEQTVKCAFPEKPHRMNSYATPTCATDGERVVAFFGPGGLHCYDLEGNILWSREFGDFPGPWGVAASPVIVGSMVVQNCDGRSSSLVALDLPPGTDLADQARGQAAWGLEHAGPDRGGGKEGACPEWGTGCAGIRSEDWQGALVLPRVQWAGFTCSDLRTDCSLSNGKPGDTYAVRPGGSGMLNRTGVARPAPGGRDLPSPAVVGDFVIVASMSGLATCYSAKSGEVLWQEHLGVKGEYAAAPLVVNGHLMFQTVYGGKTVVIKPGRKFEVVGVNDLGAEVDEAFRATLSPINGKIYARSHSMLYCIGSK